jgi:glycerate dehydrogenase
MKIVVLDGYTLNPGDLSWDGFKAMGDFRSHDRTPENEIVPRIGDADIVLVNKVPMTRSTIEACPSIRYIGVLATGYNAIDLDAAREKGIVVCNIPTYGTTAVAQFVFALLLEACHHVADHSQSVFAGKWTASKDFCYWDSPLVELYQKTMGIIGFGRIGQSVAKIASAFGMNVLAFDEYKDPSLESESVKYADLDTVLRGSDVISLHCPLTKATNGIIDAVNLSKMKDGVIIINTSRGPLVAEEDMRRALESGKVAYFAADVVSTEPIAAGNPLLRARNCILTPHIAWAPKESRGRLMAIALENLRAFARGDPINFVK